MKTLMSLASSLESSRCQSRSLFKRALRRWPSRVLAFAAAVSLLGIAGAAQAATLSWDPLLTGTTTGARGGDGTWDVGTTLAWFNGSTDALWTDSTGTADTAVFSGTNGTVTISGIVGALRVLFTTSGYTLTGAGGQVLNLGSGGIDASTLSAGTTTIGGGTGIVLGANQTWNVGGGASVVVSGSVSGGFSITKAGDGGLTLSAANTYSGGTLLNGGTLTIGNSSALGTGTTTFNGGTLNSNLNGGTQTASIFNILTTGTLLQTVSGQNFNYGNGGGIVGSGTLTVAVTGTSSSSLLTFGNSSANAFSAFTGTLVIGSNHFGNIRFGGGGNGGTYGNSTMTLDMGTGSGRIFPRNTSSSFIFGTLTGSGTASRIDGNSTTTLTVGGANTNSTFSGLITNVGNITLVKTGGGTLSLTNTNYYNRSHPQNTRQTNPQFSVS